MLGVIICEQYMYRRATVNRRSSAFSIQALSGDRSYTRLHHYDPLRFNVICITSRAGIASVSIIGYLLSYYTRVRASSSRINILPLFRRHTQQHIVARTNEGKLSCCALSTMHSTKCAPEFNIVCKVIRRRSHSSAVLNTKRHCSCLIAISLKLHSATPVHRLVQRREPYARAI